MEIILNKIFRKMENAAGITGSRMPLNLAALPQSDIDQIVGDVQKLLPANRYTVSIEPYVRGSAFIGVKAHA